MRALQRVNLVIIQWYNVFHEGRLVVEKEITMFRYKNEVYIAKFASE
jgi:hypothetical protein